MTWVDVSSAGSDGMFSVSISLSGRDRGVIRSELRPFSALLRLRFRELDDRGGICDDDGGAVGGEGKRSKVAKVV